MVEKFVRQTSKKTWYRWSVYINVVLFFIVALMIYFLIIHSIEYGKSGGEMWRWVTFDIGILAVAISLIFFQFFRNLFTIIKRSL
jgi:hypothetical protein